MERMMDRRRQQTRRKMMRMMVVAMIYAGLLLGAVTVFLGGVWFLKNFGYGWLVISGLCLIVGGILFFRLSQEGQAEMIQAAERGRMMEAGWAA